MANSIHACDVLNMVTLNHIYRQVSSSGAGRVLLINICGLTEGQAIMKNSKPVRDSNAICLHYNSDRGKYLSASDWSLHLRVRMAVSFPSRILVIISEFKRE